MKDNYLKRLYNFITFAQGLKKVERFKGMFYWRDYPKIDRYESVADHSWRVALMAVLFEEVLPKKFDLKKALKIALVHDLAEIIAGDASPLGETGTGIDSHAYNLKQQAKRHKEEKAAAKQIFSKLPNKLGQELFNLWKEYENKGSYEAKVVRALDKIEAMMQIQEYRSGSVFKAHQEFNLKYLEDNASLDPLMLEFSRILSSKMKKSFKEFKK